MKKIKTFSILFILLLFIPAQAREWETISAKYSTVEYPQGLENIADSLLKIAEITIPQISSKAGLPLSSFDDEKARIILVDVLDIPNGIALNNTVVILALSSDYIPSLTGTQKWYEQVLTHELVHLVTFRKLRRKINFLGNLFYLTTPRWFWEGTAQYFSESWNACRGDLYLKNALFDGKLTIASLFNSEDAYLLYATAHSFTRYLTNQYGDSSLIKLMSCNEDGLFYDFNDAFLSVYGKSVHQMFPHFVKHLILYYGDKYADYPEIDFSQMLPSFGYSTNQVIPLKEDSTFLVSTRLHENHLYSTALIAQIKNKQILIRNKITNDFHTPLVLSQDQNLLAFGRYHLGIEDNLTALSFDWFAYNRVDQSLKKVADKIHARYAEFDQEDNLVLIEITPEKSIVHNINLTSGVLTKVLETKISLGNIEYLSANKFLVDGQQQNGNRDIFLLSGNKLIPLTDDEIDDRNPVAVNDSLFVFNRYVYENPAIAAYHLKKNQFKVIANCLSEYWAESINKTTNSLIASQWNPGREAKFSSIPIDSLINNPALPNKSIENKKYAKWTKQQPGQSLSFNSDSSLLIKNSQTVTFPQFPLMHGLTLAFPTYDKEYQYGIYGITTWFEMLQRQALSATFLLFPKDIDNSLLFVNHFIRFYDLNIFSLYYHGPVFFKTGDLQNVKLIRDIFALDVGRFYYLEGNQRLSFYPSVSLSWNKQRIEEKPITNEYGLNYFTVRMGGSFNYHLPTKLYPFLPKREIGFYSYFHQSLTKEYNFQIQEIGGYIGSNIFIEQLGIKSEGTYLNLRGKQIPYRTIGIDRFYETNIERDFGLTRSVRGIREDIMGDELWWYSNEISLLLLKRNSLKLLFLPMENIALTGFFDYAKVIYQDEKEVYSYGCEFTFGPTFMRLGVGYAKAKMSDDQKVNEYYFRVAFTLPGMKNRNHSYDHEYKKNSIYLD